MCWTWTWLFGGQTKLLGFFLLGFVMQLLLPYPNGRIGTNLTFLLLLEFFQEPLRLISTWADSRANTITNSRCFLIVRHPAFVGSTKEVLTRARFRWIVAIPEIRIMRVIILSRSRLFSILLNLLLSHGFLIPHYDTCLQLLILEPIEEVDVNVLLVWVLLFNLLPSQNRSVDGWQACFSRWHVR